LYWDFLIRHEDRFKTHPRMALQVKNLTRLSEAERQAIQQRAGEVRRTPGLGDA
jgi:deoxyribodipyrimidine photolyase-related protein